jgi:FKBP-type peptidyl-prolyl cis-trans isomerase FkpA
MHRCLVLLCMLITAGCSPAPAPPVVVPEAVTFAPSLRVELHAMRLLTTGVYVRDLVEGEGRPARPGRRVTLHYTGFLSDGTQIEQVTLPTPPVEFELGQRTMIRGLESGILEMRPGGRRQLVIPPSQGYGVHQSGRVPPNSTLVYFVQLVSVY